MLTSQQALKPQLTVMDDAQIMASLVDRLNKLELDVDSLVGGASANCSNSSRSMRKVDSMSLEFESTFSWPVSCTLEFAEGVMARRFSHRMVIVPSELPGLTGF